MTTYQPRLMDQRLQELLRSVPAVSVEGARAVGKTRTARTHGTTFIAVDDITKIGRASCRERV